MAELVLKHGQRILVDDEDYPYLSQFKWHGGRVITRHNKINGVWGKPKYLKLHRVVMNCTDPNLEVDHINHNLWDNRKCNLRICTSGQNTSNRSPKKNGTSKYLGVCKVRDGYFTAQIGKNKKTIPLGRFENEEDAARAYNEAAMKLHGDFANPNIIP